MTCLHPTRSPHSVRTAQVELSQIVTVDTPPLVPVGLPSLWTTYMDRLARSASRAALVLPGVTTAQVQITGSESAPVLHVDCGVRGAGDVERVLERVTLSIVASLEHLIGSEFAERHIMVRQDHPSA